MKRKKPTCIPNIIVVNVLSCNGPSIFMTKFISVKLLTRMDFLSSPTPSSTCTNLRRLNTDKMSFPRGRMSDFLNTEWLMPSLPVSGLSLLRQMYNIIWEQELSFFRRMNCFSITLKMNEQFPSCLKLSQASVSERG